MDGNKFRRANELATARVQKLSIPRIRSTPSSSHDYACGGGHFEQRRKTNATTKTPHYGKDVPARGPEYSYRMDISGAASIIGALGIGSFIGQYLIGSQQRRQLRSEVLRQLASTEASRWNGTSSTDASRRQFDDSVRELVTAAIIARVPRKPLMLYLELATAARNMSDEDVDANPGQDEAGVIHPGLNRCVRDAATALSGLMWSPWLARAHMNRQANAIERDVRSLDTAVVSAVDKAKKFHTYY